MSLSEVIQASEMELFVRFCDDTDKCVKVGYYGSMFPGYGRHTGILNHPVRITKDLKSEYF